MVRTFSMPSLHLCILDAKYEQVDVDDVADNQKHLTPTQREEFKAVFCKHRQLFDGTLGVFPHKKCHIELEEGAEPPSAAYSS